VIAIGSFIRVLSYATGDTEVQPELFVWTLLGSISATFSTGCFVLVGVRAAERRLARQARLLRAKD
jgi:hypothetical protein